MRLAGRRYDQEQPIWIEVLDGVITEVGTWQATDKAALPWIAPGLVDLQVNGHSGHDFTDPHLSGDDVEQISRAMDADGVTTYLPTVVTHHHDVLAHSLGTIAQAIDACEAVRSRAGGIHLEGPFISPEEGPRGAHPLEHCRPPNWDEFQQLQAAARGYIKLVTLSPEYEGATDVIRRIVDTGVLVAIGHTNANSDQIQAAVDAGASLSTHLGNGTHALIRRHPNYVWDQLADDRLTATLIADGHHLPPAVVKCMVRAKMPERIVLISDITGIAGAVNSEPGTRCDTFLGPVEVLDDGRVVMAGQREYLAGATRPLREGVTNVMRFAQVDLATAINMASVRPAQLLGIQQDRFAQGVKADLVQFEFVEDDHANAQMKIVATINSGQCVFGEPATM